MRDRGATRALVLGVLALWFGVFAPFAIFSGARSLRRIRASNGALRGTASAVTGLVSGSIALIFAVVGIAYWLAVS